MVLFLKVKKLIMSILQTLNFNRTLLRRWAQGLFVLLWMLVLPSLVSGQNRYVSTSGTDAGSCNLPGSPCLTIGYAMGQAVAGDNINVAAGTYNENVNINKQVNLIGAGSASTIVQGSYPGITGTFLLNNISNVSISGFHLNGFDGVPAIETAALYFQGVCNNITITNNRITANGDAALLTEYGQPNNNLNISNNTFDGQTFIGPNPGGCGFAGQFTDPNVPRELVTIATGTTNVTFNNNIVSGVSGGIGTIAPCDVIGQGNSLVTIDATNASITNNTFNGTTSRYGSMLRTRGTQVSISNNTFDGSNLFGPATYYFYDSDALTGGTPNTLQGVFDENTFLPYASFIIDTPGNTIIFICDEIVLNTEINNESVVTDNDGISDSTAVAVCNISSNIQFGTWSINLPSPPHKVFQIIQTSNVNVPFCNNCVGTTSVFTGSHTASLINPALNGQLIMKFVAFNDVNSNDIFDFGECPSDTVVYVFTVYAFPTAPQLEANPDENEVCEGRTLTVDITSPGSGGAEPCVDEYRYSTDNGSTWSAWSATVPSFSAVKGTNTIQSRRSCDLDDCPSNIYDVSWAVNSNPTANITPSPAEVCQGVNLQLNGNPSGGSGSYTHVWSGTGSTNLNNVSIQSPVFNSTSVGQVTLLYTVTDGNGCIGTDTEVVEVFGNPTVTISPDPAEVCPGANLVLNTNVNGGTPSYNYLWSGAGASSLNNTGISAPTYNSTTLGQNSIGVTVTDANGCIGTDAVDVVVEDDTDPVISCPTVPVTMSADQDRCTAVVCFTVSATDDCPAILPVSLPGHTYIGTYNGHTYFRSNTTFSWEAANAAAVALGGNLVSISDQSEQSFLNSNIPNSLLNQFWIGLRYSPSLNQFKWTTGEPVNYLNWGLLQPVNFPPLSGDYVFHLELGSPVLEGWYNVLDVLPRRYIIEFSGYPVKLVSGLPSGSNFPVGTTSVTYNITDLGGNTDVCTFDVVVTDDQAPEITCPGDITVNLPQGDCDSVVDFESDIVFTDNCSGTVFHYVSGSPESGDNFPIGVHTVSIYAEDAAGNLSDTCSFTITIVDYINPNLGCKPVNLSLDGDCIGSLTPTEVLVGWETGGIPDLGCPGSFTIDITDSNGNSIGNYLTGEYLGQTLGYTISHLSGFKCWSTVLVEDKMAPTIACRDTAVHCMTDLTKLKMYTVFDNCGANAVIIDEKIENLTCNPDYVCRILRTYKAVDNYGNESAPCTSVIYIQRPSRIGILAPVANDTLECSAVYEKDENGNPHPNVTGIPTFEGRALWPQSNLDLLYCGALIRYNDNVVFESSCKKRIMRTWTITEWWCSTTVELLVAAQIIDIVDTTPPVIPQHDDFTVTTQALSCSALVTLPALNITDNCNEIKKVVVNATSDGVPTGTLSSNGGTMVLEVGEHIITYTALDKCLNQSERSFKVTVRDNTDPVAICDQYATVSLREDGQTFVTASAIDDGSFDACGDITLKIRRMTDPCATGQDTSWYDRLDFCCLDANTSPMVALLVTDKGGNTNMCMISVQVQDKIEPSITCPGDLTIEDCLFTFDPSRAGADYAFGSVVITDNCPGNVDISHTLVDNRTQCGIGDVVRTFSILKNGAATQTCTQTITFRNHDPFYINSLDPNDPLDDVIWPKDYLALGQCSFNGLLPEALPDSSSFPIVTEDACDMTGVRYDDQIFPFTTNGACYKIIRTWTIIDWCQNRTWTYEQEIKVMDNDAPVFDNLPTTTVVFNTATCTSTTVTIGAQAHDCTPAEELKWTYTIFKDGLVYDNGSTSSVTRTFEVGDYHVEFTVGDRCGNLSEASYDFVVRTTKPAVPVCLKGLSSTVTLMDTDGDGIGDTPQTMLRPAFFDNKSSHPCGYDFVLSFSADINDTLRTYTCDSIGSRTVQLWVTDQNGNTAYCETFVDIQDNSNLCGPTGPLVSNVSGRTVKEDNQPIENVEVALVGTESDVINTNKEGNYAFSNVRNNVDYNIIPGKDGDDINGVSTYDLVLIQRHILGMELLNSPYKLIAADINNNGSVSAADLTELRKLILGVIPGYTKNTSWRFVDAAHKFDNPADPWSGFIPEFYGINKLRSNMDVNFIGVKVGDVNNDAVGADVASQEVSSRTAYSVAIADRNISKGELVHIPVIADNANVLLGLQGQLQANGLIIKGITSAAMKITGSDYAVSAGESIRIALASGEGVQVNKGQVLFVIEAEATQSGKLSDMIQLNTDFNPEMYTANKQINRFGIQWRNAEVAYPVLSTIAPNPWNAYTEIKFDLPADGMVTFKVKDYTGKKWISKIDFFKGGQNTIKLTRNDIPQSGVYIYEIKTENQVLSGKMIVIE